MQGLSCSPVLILFLLHKLLQVIRIIPYSAVQLFSYEVYKVIICPCYTKSPIYFELEKFSLTMFLLSIQKVFRRNDGELTVFGRLAAGACAGMTSTLVIYLFAYFLGNIVYL